MTRTTLAVAADYADALITARRAKNWLFILLLIMLLLQIALFVLVRFDVLRLSDRAGITTATSMSTSTTPATTEPAVDGTVITPVTPVTPVTPPASTTTPPRIHSAPVGEILSYVIPVIDFLGITLVIVLSVVLLLLTAIMLVGRLIGVSYVTSAFIWSAVLTVFLFPWQAFLITSETPSLYTGAVTTVAPQPAFKVPGVLYTYPELYQDQHFPNQPVTQAILKWARYVAFPVLAVLVLLLLQARSSRGLKMALGEADIQVDMAARDTLP